MALDVRGHVPFIFSISLTLVTWSFDSFPNHQGHHSLALSSFPTLSGFLPFHTRHHSPGDNFCSLDLPCTPPCLGHSWAIPPREMHPGLSCPFCPWMAFHQDPTSFHEAPPNPSKVMCPLLGCPSPGSAPEPLPVVLSCTTAGYLQSHLSCCVVGPGRAEDFILPRTFHVKQIFKICLICQINSSAL